MKVVIMLLCIVSNMSLSSCIKDDNNSSNQFGNYTLGYYHPSKKISKLTIYAHETMVISMTPLPHYYEFSWDGNDLKSITAVGRNGDTVAYEYVYSDNGYITSINHRVDQYSGVQEVMYSKNKVKMFNSNYDYLGYGVFWFDSDGNLTSMNNTNISMSDGNPQGLFFSGTEITFDNHPNPFKNIILPESIYKLFSESAYEAVPISSNNSKYIHDIYYETDNDNSYPVSFSGANSSKFLIEYE